MIAYQHATLRSDEQGLTMVELIIFVVFSAIVAALATAVFINTVIGQSQVTSVTESTTRGQAISQSIERALRNATGATITADGSGNAILSVLTTLEPHCQAWRVTPTGELAAATGAGLATWGVLSDRAESIGGDPYFSWDGSRVRYRFALATDGRPVEFSGAILPRGTGGSVGDACS